MLYCYDNAIAEDLQRSFNTDINIIKVADSDIYTELAAQSENDQLKFPMIGLTRSSDIEIDTNRLNFTRLHKGVPTVFDNKTNDIYYEQVVPINLSYDLTVLAANTADSDELVRELIFKYTKMYFITMPLPYESDRSIKFGIVLDSTRTISRKSGLIENIHSGTIYQTILALKCEGCVLLSYNPVKLQVQLQDPQIDIQN